MSLNDILIDNIRRLLTDRRLSQAELSDRMDISPTYLSRLMKGKISFTNEMVDRMAKAFGVSVDEIATRPPVVVEGTKHFVPENVYKVITEPDFEVMFQMYHLMKDPGQNKTGMGQLIAKQLQLIADAVRFCKPGIGDLHENEENRRALRAHIKEKHAHKDKSKRSASG